MNFWERLLEQADRSGDCWLWLGRIDFNGNALIRIGGRVLHAHRVFYECFIGKIPPGVVVLRECGNRACVKPSHLVAQTRIASSKAWKNRQMERERMDNDDHE